MGCYFLGFGSIAVAVTGALYALIVQRTTDWPPYLVYLAAVNGTTFLLYGLDKMISKGRWRAPEAFLHTLALAGGVAGAWLGRIIFEHKISTEKRPAFSFWLWIGLIGHSFLAYYLLFRET